MQHTAVRLPPVARNTLQHTAARLPPAAHTTLQHSVHSLYVRFNTLLFCKFSKSHESLPAATYPRTNVQKDATRPAHSISAIKLVFMQQYKHVLVQLPPVQASTARGWLSANTAPLILMSG
jgi:hypothetical protein